MSFTFCIVKNALARKCFNLNNKRFNHDIFKLIEKHKQASPQSKFQNFIIVFQHIKLPFALKSDSKDKFV